MRLSGRSSLISTNWSDCIFRASLAGIVGKLDASENGFAVAPEAIGDVIDPSEGVVLVVALEMRPTKERDGLVEPWGVAVFEGPR